MVHTAQSAVGDGEAGLDNSREYVVWFRIHVLILENDMMQCLRVKHVKPPSLKKQRDSAESRTVERITHAEQRTELDHCTIVVAEMVYERHTAFSLKELFEVS